jgi:uncharacterized protein
MTPLFFGTHDKQLLGLHHPPESDDGTARAVLLCYPGAQEFLRTHWAFRRLAAALARGGAHALRFDYFGTGDSAGDTRDGTVEQWLSDIATAAQELKDLSGAPRVSVIGLRLGAALAALATAGGLEVDTLVLWEPIVSGRTYLDELTEIHKRKIARALYPPPLESQSEQPELLGFPFPRRMRAGIEGIDLRRTLPTATRIRLMVSEERTEPKELHVRLRDAARQAEYTYLPEGRDAQREKLEAALLSDVMLRAIAGLFAGATR